MSLIRSIFARGDGWRLNEPVRSIALADLYPTATFPDWIRTWPDGSQDVLQRDGTIHHIVAHHGNHPNFEATRVGLHSELYPFDGSKA